MLSHSVCAFVCGALALTLFALDPQQTPRHPAALLAAYGFDHHFEAHRCHSVGALHICHECALLWSGFYRCRELISRRADEVSEAVAKMACMAGAGVDPLKASTQACALLHAKLIGEQAWTQTHNVHVTTNTLYGPQFQLNGFAGLGAR